MNAQQKARKKLSVFRKALFVALAILLVIMSTAAVAYWRYVYPTAKVMPDLYAIRTHNNGMPMGNLFLLQIGNEYIAIDAGADIDQTENGLSKLGLPANDVVAVFITHAHWDHIGSLELFENATIYTGNTENSEFPDIPHRVLSDSETIRLSGMSIQCFYTPGHTIDSVCYLVNGKYLFVGDLLVSTNDPPPPIPKRYDKDLQLLYREKILDMDEVEYVFTGHFGLFKDVRLFRWWWL